MAIYRWHLTLHSSTKNYKLYVFTQQSVKRNCESESDECRLLTTKFVPKKKLALRVFYGVDGYPSNSRHHIQMSQSVKCYFENESDKCRKYKQKGLL